METVLRKIKISDGLPKKEGWYAFEGSSGIHGIYWHNDWDKEELESLKIEYWYEEISILDLFKEKEPTIGEQIIVSKLFAEQRYEKAKQLLNSNNGLGTTELIDKCLKIAAGLEK